MNPVTLTPTEAQNALNTLTYADTVLLNMAQHNGSVDAVRGELLALRRLIARQYNATDTRTNEQREWAAWHYEMLHQQAKQASEWSAREVVMAGGSRQWWVYRKELPWLRETAWGHPLTEAEAKTIAAAMANPVPEATSPYVDIACGKCGGNDRVLANWEHNGTTYVGICIACRREVAGQS